MPKFRKRPVAIDAERFSAGAWLIAGELPKGAQVDEHGQIYVETIHAGQRVVLEDGDWVAPEPDGVHFYPIKPDIFEATYEPLEG